jgi:hypothetical protein
MLSYEVHEDLADSPPKPTVPAKQETVEPPRPCAAKAEKLDQNQNMSAVSTILFDSDSRERYRAVLLLAVRRKDDDD